MGTLEGLKNTPMADIINELESSDKNHTFSDFDKKYNGEIGNYAEKTKDGSFTYFDPMNSISSEGERRSPLIGLSHEMTHDYDISKGYNPYKTLDVIRGVSYSEIKAVNVENTVRKQLGLQYAPIYGAPQRTTYAGRAIPSMLLGPPRINNFNGYYGR